jgi:rare lipoprotein A
MRVSRERGLDLAMRLIFCVCGLAAAVVLSGCSSKKEKLDPFAGVGSPYYKGAGPMPKGGGKYHLGKPYQVAGRWFTPKEQPNYDKTGTASWYGEAFHRRKTSNGEWFNMNDMTAAHATLPIPSYAKVTNLENGLQIVVRINDRGPFVDTRIMDLSKRSATALGFINQGMAKVRVQWIGPAPLNDNGNHLVTMNQALVQGEDLPGLRQVAGSGETYRTPASASAESPVPMRQKAGKGYVIQVATFAEQSNAMSAMSMVSSIADAKLERVESADGPVYRTTIGPIMNEAQAIQILEQVQAQGFQDARMNVATRQFALLQ